MNATRRAVLLLFAALLLAPAVPAPAQSEYFFPAGQTFDPAIPSPEQFLGYPIGSHHTRHDRIVAYMQELARLSDRASYQEIGQTYGHRAMPVLTVTAPANHARLEQIRTRHLAGLEPGGPAPAADEPVIVHLGYGVHGNETSSSEAAMLTAYWLVAGTGAEVQRYLAEGVFHVEPNLNPDGRDRHTHWANMHKGTPPVTDPLDREHNEAWPGGRTNHYWFDLNRDWLPLENPESRARIEWHHRWRPHVVTDYHEMGTNGTYYFEPSEPRASWNPLIPERMYTGITEDFARYYARALDDIGSLYFTKEVFDNSYPGYGSTYPKFLGGYAITFEQASARGHAQRSSHHGVLTFAFAIRNHLRTSLGVVQAAVDQRRTLQEYQREFFETALTEADRYPVKAYVFGDPHDPSRNRAFLDLLLRHRLEVYELPAALEAGGHRFEPGSAWVVPTRQPLYRMARSIFERTSEYADSAFYDASTWTISLAYDMPDAELRSRPALGRRVTEAPGPQGLGTVPRSGYAYLLDWSDYYAPRALWYLLDRGVRAEAAFRPFSILTHAGQRSYPRGTISIPVATQEMDAASLHRLVLEAERHAGVPIQAAASGYALEGPDLGSGSFRPVTRPRVAMLVGDGVSANEAGQLWHLLDTKVGMPMTKIDRRDFPRADLGDYDVLVLPSGDYSYIAGDRLEELRRWVRGGGTLVAQRTAARWAVRNGLAPNVGPELDAPARDSAAAPLRRDYADADDLLGAQVIGGSIWLADVDTTHPLGFGYHRRALPVWRDHSIFLPPSRSPFGTVARLTDDPHLSGYVSAANERRLRGSPSVLADQLGQGAVVLMLDNPNFRGYWWGTNRLFLNALFFGGHIEAPPAP